nr:retrovirus-related Pol polyprotein from transposon TNT 1-94 [Tanacetum cinerariifolium]
EVLIDFLRLVQRGLQAQVRVVRTDKGTKFMNQTLHAYFTAEGIQHQTSVDKAQKKPKLAQETRPNRPPYSKEYKYTSPHLERHDYSKSKKNRVSMVLRVVLKKMKCCELLHGKNEYTLMAEMEM